MTSPYRTPGERPLGPRWGATWRARLYVRLFVRHHQVNGRHVRVERVWLTGETTRTWKLTHDAPAPVDSVEAHLRDIDRRMLEIDAKVREADRKRAYLIAMTRLLEITGGRTR